MSSSKTPNFDKLFQNYTECPEPSEAKIKGEIPEWVSGTLLRNGPGIFKVGKDEFKHLFDGLALIQRYHIENGKVYYSTRFLDSTAYKRNLSAQRIVISEFGTVGYPDPCKSIFNRYFSYYFPFGKDGNDITDNGLVNFLQSGDEVYAATETPWLTRIDPETLETGDKVNVNDIFAVNTFTAHPHCDREGNVYNMGSGNKTYNIIKIPKPTTNESGFSKAEVIMNIPHSKMLNPSYYHSFGITENYVVFPEMPLRFAVWKLLTSHWTNNSFMDCLSWSGEDKVRIYLTHLHTKQLHEQVYTTDSFFTFHHANSYEHDNCIVADFSGYNDASLIKEITVEQMRKGQVSGGNIGCYLHRLILPLEVHKDAKPGDNLLKYHSFNTRAKAILQLDGSIHLQSEKLCEAVFEFPRINYENFNARKYRFVYGSNFFSYDKKPAVVKVDVETGDYRSWFIDHDGQTAGEPVFVPKPDGKDEDNGVVLVPVSTINDEDKPFLLFLDGKTFEEVARAYVSSSIPFGFHALYLSSKIN